MSDWPTHHVRRRRWWLRREWRVIVSDAEWKPRAWWRGEAGRMATTMSALLRQRVRVRWWINAGRPPLSAWLRKVRGDV